MDQFSHVIITMLCIYFAFKIGKNINNKSMAEEVVFETLNHLEKKGFIKYVIKDGEKIYLPIQDIKKEL